MSTPMTNYTTYDLEYYYTDLKQLPLLSREARYHLATSEIAPQPLTPTTTSCERTSRKQRLMEAYLPLAKHLAILHCPPTLYRRLLPDLIGAVNLAVVEAITRCDLGRIRNLDAYLASYVRVAIRRTLSTDDLLPIPWRVRQRAREEGHLDQIYAQYHVASLEALMASHDPDAADEPRLTPLTPTQAAPPRDPALRAQVERWLSY